MNMYIFFFYKTNWNGFYAFKYIYIYISMKIISIYPYKIFKALLKNSLNYFIYLQFYGNNS